MFCGIVYGSMVQYKVYIIVHYEYEVRFFFILMTLSAMNWLLRAVPWDDCSKKVLFSARSYDVSKFIVALVQGSAKWGKCQKKTRKRSVAAFSLKNGQVVDYHCWCLLLLGQFESKVGQMSNFISLTLEAWGS